MLPNTLDGSYPFRRKLPGVLNLGTGQTDCADIRTVQKDCTDIRGVGVCSARESNSKLQGGVMQRELPPALIALTSPSTPPPRSNSWQELSLVSARPRAQSAPK